MRYIYIDTEFTDFNLTADLVSMALVCGNKYYYVELTDNYAPEDVTNFVYDCVLPFLDAPYSPKMELGCVYTRAAKKEAVALLVSWLGQFKNYRVTLVTDSAYYDYKQLQKLLGKQWPSFLNHEPLIIDSVTRETFGSHHAYEDVLHIRSEHTASLKVSCSKETEIFNDFIEKGARAISNIQQSSETEYWRGS